MAKNCYTLSLKLSTQPFEEHILNKRFNISQKIYNIVLRKSLNRYKELTKTKAWRENQLNILEVYKNEKDEKKRKSLCNKYFSIKNELLKEFNLSEYSLHKDVKDIQKYYKNNIDSFTSQKIASRVWKSLQDNLFGKGEKVKFKGYNNPLLSVEGKSNKTGIRYDLENNILIWNCLKIDVNLNINNKYEIDALRDKICYCRIKRKFIRGRYKYILQLVLEGTPPIKVNKKTGEVKNSIGLGDIGIDIGTQTIAFVSDFDSKLYELAPNVKSIENQKRLILRYLDRSKRKTNPQNFNEDGTIKKGIKLKWNYSKRYIKARNILKDLYRKQTDIRLLDHNILANEILKQGDTIYIEDMNFKALQKRSLNTEISEKTNKFKRKKRFGKSLANKGPSSFLDILERKITIDGGKYIKINTREVKASQYNHLNQEYNKKKLSQRWNTFNYKNKEIKVQRDLYSAYLIKNINNDLKTINNEKCIKDFDEFLINHNKEIERLSNLKNLSSMGI